jgi:hypothetical protein
MKETRFPVPAEARREWGDVSREIDDIGFGTTFSAESRVSLGLDPDEGLRVLARAGRAIPSPGSRD